jgi:hypothetical protein
LCVCVGGGASWRCCLRWWCCSLDVGVVFVGVSACARGRALVCRLWV